MIRSAAARLRAEFRRFCPAQNANVATIFGLSLVPVMLMVGAGIDYSRASRIRSAMQASLDSTGLLLARNPSIASFNASQVQQQASTYFNAEFHSTNAYKTAVSATFDNATQTISLAANAMMDTSFMGLAGINQMNIATTAQVTWGLTRLRVALVLDNTGSMNESGKIDALKTASHQLLTQLKSIEKAGGDVKVAIVPFTTDVNISSYADKNTSWIDWSEWSPAGSIEDGLICNSGGVTCGGSDHSAWNGCVMDRAQPYDTLSTKPTSSTTYFPANQSGGCPTPMMALTNDWTALNDKIDAMVANGYTNQTVGLAWGWQALTPGVPLKAGKPKPDTQQAIVLLTDGLNTRNRWSSSEAQIDTRTAAACANIKAAGIIIYTVLVMSGDSSILKSCANDQSKYFALTQANEMVSTFSQIGTSLAQLRISK